MTLYKLDYLRGFAAAYVVLGHIVEQTRFGKVYVASELLKQGQVAVMLFFILSGFVIHYNYYSKDFSFKIYFIKRFRRIYPIFLISILIGFLIACYTGVLDKRTWFDLLGNLINMQDLPVMEGTNVKPYFNAPLWSLSYEWFFYIMYLPLIWYSRKKNFCIYNISLVLSFLGFLFYLFYPNKIALNFIYLIIWSTGADIAENYFLSKKYLIKIFIKHIFVFLFFSIVFFSLYMLDIDQDGLAKRHWFRIFQHFFVSLGLISIAFIWKKAKWLFFDKIFKTFNNVAPFSYALYVIHQPIMILFFKNYGNKKLDPIEIICSMAITIIISWALEVKLQPIINQYSKRFIKINKIEK